jgi:hypothetical protein
MFVNIKINKLQATKNITLYTAYRVENMENKK